jgi:hypothetical protein
MDKNLRDVQKRICEVDLSAVIERLVHIDKWPRKQALAACQQYRNYLFLKKKYEDSYDLPPSVDIDEVWHAHILHSEEYIEFCQQTFGHYLHHHPHHGKGNILTDQQVNDLFEKTQYFYNLEFGEYIYAIRPIAWKKKIKMLGSELKLLWQQKFSLLKTKTEVV